MSTTDDRSMVLPAEYSAQHLLTRRQKFLFVLAVAVLAVCAMLNWTATGAVLISIATIYFVLSTIDRTILLATGLSRGAVITVTAEQARAIDDEDLPVYSVLLPVYDEPDIVSTLVAGIGRIDYPADKLDVYVILEADDAATIAAFDNERVSGIIPVLVPPSLPRTKPKACNYAMELSRERSEYVTIFDADDLPEPLQLRRAAAVFAMSSNDVAAVQARLSYFNERQNLLTKWFAIEYDQWFAFVLPALTATGCVIPLGGSSNHIRTSVLRELGGWDPFNVTEDADLGIRLARNGYRTVLVDSQTEEEANADSINWLRQRSRWYKGYLETFVVHTRRPFLLYRQLGLKPMLRFVNLTAGMPIANMLNVGFWSLLLIWYAGRPTFMNALFPGPVYYLCVVLFTVGNSVAILLGIISARSTNKPHLLFAALLVPGYWFLQAVAAVKSVSQLLYNHSYWEKTVHGLTQKEPPE
jgi:glycosyltransferase XagB